MVYPSSLSSHKPSHVTLSSTGLNPEGWRGFWRVNGTSWRSLIDLHFEICDRVRASSSSRVSS
jgi:hypothetical protein